MLRVGVHYRKVNYNREEILVYHLTDDITGRPMPICGADGNDLSDDSEADWLLKRIKGGSDPFVDDEAVRMCERCRRIHLAPGEEAEKSKRRLARWKRKEARRKLIELHERQVIEQWLGRCPKCQNEVEIEEPRGYSSASAHCEGCELQWSFSISTQHSGTVVIWADDEAGIHSGKAKGHVKLKGINWEWR